MFVIAACLSAGAFAAPRDAAPIPDDVVEILVRPHATEVAHPLAEKLEKQLNDIQEVLNDLQSPDLASTHATKLQILEAADIELEVKQTQWDDYAKAYRKRIEQRIGNHTKDWDDLQLKIDERFGRIKNALQAVHEAKNEGARIIAIRKAQEVLHDLYEKRRERQLEIGKKPIPTWTQQDPGPSRKEPESSSVPAYIAAQEAAAKTMYAVLGDINLVAAPVTPVEAATCNFTPADLADDGQEIQLTTEIRDLAAKLEYSPARILEYVSNEIEFEPYFGSLKGAIGTLYTKAGGPADQSSLLIALLRASNIPARYVRGTIDVVDATPLGAEGMAPKWTGTKSYIAAANVLALGGFKTATPLSNGVEMSHVWVQACIPYSHYRGARVTNAGHRWVPMDPSFKEKTYQPGIDTNVDFDYTSYLATRSNTLPDEAYADQIAAAIKTQAPRYADNTLADVPYTGHIVPRKLDIIPVSLPYEVSAFVNWSNTGTPETATLPDSHRHFFNITVKNSAGTVLLQTAINMPVNVLNRITLSFKGLYASDQAALDAWKNDGNAGSAIPCTINVVPEIKIEGITQAVGSGSVGLCSIDNKLDLSITLTDSRSSTTVVNSASYSNIGAANYHALQGYAFQASDRLLSERVAKLTKAVNDNPDPNNNQEETEGEFLNIVGLKYMRYVSDASKRIGRLRGDSGESGNHIGLVTTAMKV
jgi:transglutaminase-like putative cysteine protease